MHELSLMEGMLDVIEEQAREGGFGRVHVVVLEVGKLAGVEVEALRFAFDVVTKGTRAEGARLELQEPAGMAWCEACGQEVEVAARFEPCPLCLKGSLRLTDGTQIRVMSLEVA
ncbi:MAG TPA: hydrogenase maturation nickel metallochaperone HypA [Holophagaceae bacterium]|nr:hydrogenase maturation nickel metallochaperone HypA [Holophagaceae bacterium]